MTSLHPDRPAVAPGAPPAKAAHRAVGTANLAPARAAVAANPVAAATVDTPDTLATVADAAATTLAADVDAVAATTLAAVADAVAFTTAGNTIAAVAVVVPVRDEERLLPSCLASLRHSADAVRQDLGLVVRLIVVLDRCTDRSADIAAAAGVDVLVSDRGQVGAARAMGMAHALDVAHALGVEPARAWLATTDADGTVPATWLLRQVRLADRGADCVVGTVEPSGLTPDVLSEWSRRHQLRDSHAHVHGANLGLRGSAYLQARGFGDRSLHEDRDLVARVRANGARVIATDSTRVTTSGRLSSRVVGGFADYLRRLAHAEGATDRQSPCAESAPSVHPGRGGDD